MIEIGKVKKIESGKESRAKQIGVLSQNDTTPDAEPDDDDPDVEFTTEHAAPPPPPAPVSTRKAIAAAAGVSSKGETTLSQNDTVISEPDKWRGCYHRMIKPRKLNPTHPTRAPPPEKSSLQISANLDPPPPAAHARHLRTITSTRPASITPANPAGDIGQDDGGGGIDGDAGAGNPGGRKSPAGPGK